jgi:hypothetical protein
MHEEQEWNPLPSLSVLAAIKGWGWYLELEHTVQQPQWSLTASPSQ